MDVRSVEYARQEEAVAAVTAKREAQDSGADRKPVADAPAQGAAAGRRKLDRGEATALARDLEKNLQAKGVALKFLVREETGSVQIEVRETSSDKVIRKIPSDDLLKLSASLKALAGAFVDKPA